MVRAKHLLKRPLENMPFKIRFGIAEGLKLLGFSSYALGNLFKKPLTKEELFIQGLDLYGKTVYDIGAYIGILTLYFAKAVGENGGVVVYEPNPLNYDKIRKNIRINRFDNVDIYPVALGAVQENVKLAFRSSATATGSIQEHIRARITGLPESTEIEVEMDTLDNQIETLKLVKPDFVKIDVEGLELDVLHGMHNTIKRNKPQLYIEIHGHTTAKKIENAEHVTGYLLENGYTVYHVETEQTITAGNAGLAREGHLWGY